MFTVNETFMSKTETRPRRDVPTKFTRQDETESFQKQVSRPSRLGRGDFEGMTLNCIHIFIVTGSFFVLMCHEAGQSAFIYESWWYLIFQCFLALMAFLCWCAVKQSINESINMKLVFVYMAVKYVRLRPRYTIIVYILLSVCFTRLPMWRTKLYIKMRLNTWLSCDVASAQLMYTGALYWQVPLLTLV